MHPYFSIGISIVGGSLLSGIAAFWVARQEVDRVRMQFPDRVDSLALTLQQQVDSSLQATTVTGRFLRASPNISEAQFAQFTDAMLPNTRGLLELGWAQVQSEGNSADPVVRKTYVRSDRDRSQPLDLATLKRARDRQRPILSPARFDPSQNDIVFSLYFPVFAPSDLSGDRFIGVVYGTYRLRDILRYSLGALDVRGVDVYLYDMSVDILDSSLIKRTQNQQEKFLFFYNAQQREIQLDVQNVPEVVASDRTARYCPFGLNVTCLRSLNIGNREWSLLVMPRWNQTAIAWKVSSTLLVGLLSTAVLASYLRSLLQQHRYTQTLNRHLRSELDISRKLQQMLLPSRQELQAAGDLEIATYMEPADEVGGDYYDILIGDRSVKIGIGDVTGHGLESGVLAIMVQTAVRTLEECHETDPRKVLDIINRTIYQNVRRMQCDKHLSLCLVDYNNGKLRVSGQHEEILIVREHGIDRIDTLDLGFPIGLDLNIQDFFNRQTFTVNPGDVVVLYTDGITEAENTARQLYGIDRLCDILRRTRDATAEDILHTILSDVREHIGRHRVYDDITLLVIKRRCPVQRSGGGVPHRITAAKSVVPSLPSANSSSPATTATARDSVFPPRVAPSD